MSIEASLIVGKEPACNVGDLGLIAGLGRSPGEGMGYPLQYSGLENFHGLYSPWGHKELDVTGWLSLNVHWGICKNHRHKVWLLFPKVNTLRQPGPGPRNEILLGPCKAPDHPSRTYLPQGNHFPEFWNHWCVFLLLSITGTLCKSTSLTLNSENWPISYIHTPESCVFQIISHEKFTSNDET